MTALSSAALNISDIPLQIEQFKEQHSVDHHQLLEPLMRLVAQSIEVVTQQKEVLREQAASKEREEKMLAELEAAKERDQEMLKMHQQTIDRLIVNQQRVEAILIQNYELHEYPIPRLFVVLPDSFKDWDPRNFLMERFRLYFLSADSPTPPIHVNNRIHPAEHEGYELSRPTEFFKSYGPYVLGMLRVLKHCVAVATVVAPAVALADSGVKDIMDGVKSLSENTMEAVDMSISILEGKLGESDAASELTATGSMQQEDENVFENLAALEGADLRRLDTFLRNNDKDKILGNLYRITTEQGHVKWVCFKHYRDRYRATALASFVQSVEAADGTYDQHPLKVSIGLKSSTTSKDFFKRLAIQAPAVETLNVTLD
ncbi:hypothetical protein EC991_002920 [Linnemannia zychae]|nr:hypothetical protein EC991_002920 [Linnemannia zychae]